MNIYFDGFCPESQLQGKQVDMRLNEDDFWESEATGLQITVFPPYAAILGWRGKGRFRPTSAPACQSLSGLVMTAARTAAGKEIFPDEASKLGNKPDLEKYILEICDSKEAFDAARTITGDPDLTTQEKYLSSIPHADLQALVELFDQAKEQGKVFTESEEFHRLHKLLYDMQIIFNFDWMEWQKGQQEIKDSISDLSTCSILEFSMYLTAIFRAERFHEGSIEANYRNGTLNKLFNGLRLRIPGN